MQISALATASAILVASVSASSAGETSWDGTWSGAVGRHDPWPATVVIAGGKVVQFTERGVAFDVRFSNVTPKGVVFGDRLNYQVELRKAGAADATGEVRGRLGAGPAHMNRT